MIVVHPHQEPRDDLHHRGVRITGVDFVTIPAKDFAASVHFYGTGLGLPLVKRWGDMPAADFQAGNVTLAVMEPTAFGQASWTPRATRSTSTTATRRRRAEPGRRPSVRCPGRHGAADDPTRLRRP